MGRLEIFGIEGIPQITRGDDLAGVSADAVARGAASSPDNALRDGDVLVVASKIVSKAEGRLEAIDPDDPLSHKPLVERETGRIIRRRGGVIATATQHG